jgi:hypothetical protein
MKEEQGKMKKRGRNRTVSFLKQDPAAPPKNAGFEYL